MEPVPEVQKNLYFGPMKLFPVSLTIAFFTLIFLTGCSDRESDNRRWFKGNLHTHSYWSDGDEFPEMIMDWYKDRGYDFVALTDHNILAQGGKVGGGA